MEGGESDTGLVFDGTGLVFDGEIITISGALGFETPGEAHHIHGGHEPPAYPIAFLCPECGAQHEIEIVIKIKRGRK